MEILRAGGKFDSVYAYYRPDVIGIKTGASGLAGSCIVSAAIINEETYICVVMGSTKDARFQDSITLYDKIESQ